MVAMYVDDYHLAGDCLDAVIAAQDAVIAAQNELTNAMKLRAQICVELRKHGVGATRIAQAIGVTPQAVHVWMNGVTR